MHKRILTRAIATLAVATLVSACEPRDRTPGLWLTGDVVESWPADWSFTDDHREIYVEVATPYLVPHSVTIWCAQVDGRLYIGARDPDTKRWPGWVDKRRDVRLKIGDKLYEASVADVAGEDVLAAVSAAYDAKYDRGGAAGGKPRTVRYWAVVPRS